MAIEKPLELDTGIVCNYWKITDIRILLSEIKFCASAFVDKAHRDISTELSVYHSVHRVPIKQINLDANLFVELYNYLHTLPEFEEGEAV